MTPARPAVVILNGVGSVGKSSTARAMQAIAARPLLHVSMDGFLDMLPARMFGHPDGLVFEPVVEDGAPALAVRSGIVVQQALTGMRQAIAAMAAAGSDMVVDEVMFGAEQTEAYRRLLPAADIRFVGLFAPLDVLQARERARGDRAIGLAQWQYSRVHRGVAYDLEIDTVAATPEEIARRICAAFGL